MKPHLITPLRNGLRWIRECIWQTIFSLKWTYRPWLRHWNAALHFSITGSLKQPTESQRERNWVLKGARSPFVIWPQKGCQRIYGNYRKRAFPSLWPFGFGKILKTGRMGHFLATSLHGMPFYVQSQSGCCGRNINLAVMIIPCVYG